jgi:hypothetical protein
VPTLSGGVAVDPVLGLDVQHLVPLVPTLPDGAVDPALGLDVPLGSTLPDGAVDPALGLDAQLPTLSPTYSSWPSPSLTRSVFTLDMPSVAATTALRPACAHGTLHRLLNVLR